DWPYRRLGAHPRPDDPPIRGQTDRLTDISGGSGIADSGIHLGLLAARASGGRDRPNNSFAPRMNAEWVSAPGALLDTETVTSSSEEGLSEVFRRMWLILVEVGQIKVLPRFCVWYWPLKIGCIMESREIMLTLTYDGLPLSRHASRQSPAAAC